jgi:hypothetical protein
MQYRKDIAGRALKKENRVFTEATTHILSGGKLLYAAVQ